MPLIPAITRRQLLARSWTITTAAAVAGLPFHLLADELATLDVAYAGSMSSMMEGPVKSSAARTLKIDLHGRGQGSSALAQLIAGGSLRPDVFIPITPGPALTILRAGKAESAQPIAHTEMVIAYSPRSRFASRFDAAAKGKADLWKILLEPELRFGRTDPVVDPQGRNIIFTMMLAAKTNKHADLVEKILGPAINEKQIFTEPTVMARLQSGELDAASAYKIQPGPLNLPYVPLPAEINLSGQDVRAEHPDITLSVGGKSYAPEPLIYYAAVLKDATNAKGAKAFVEWLKGDEAQAIFRKYQYDSPGDASPLHA
ncbi:MAG TPA: extracellular solute-binding protein [Candidatus Angelobacter sp.]|jgi:molybdate/tungstate transport system substrate-binding protein|nr:extracellular solute-binding protein [Candidatus Angelobacter sp.]